MQREKRNHRSILLKEETEFRAFDWKTNKLAGIKTKGVTTL